MTLSIPINRNLNPIETAVIQRALSVIGSQFSSENIKYIAELAEKPGANEKFDKLKKNPLVKSLL